MSSIIREAPRGRVKLHTRAPRRITKANPRFGLQRVLRPRGVGRGVDVHTRDADVRVEFLHIKVFVCISHFTQIVHQKLSTFVNVFSCSAAVGLDVISISLKGIL